MKISLNVLLKFIALLSCSLLICELTLWAVGYPGWWDIRRVVYQKASSDLTAGWINAEGTFRLHIPLLNSTVTVEHWDRGRRATRQNREPVNGPSVALLGDSFVYGSYLSDEETAAWKLQMLAPHLNIDNYGTSSYGSYQVLKMAEKILLQHPPAYIIYFFNVFHESRNVGDFVWQRIGNNNDKNFKFPFASLDSNGQLVENVSEGIKIPWIAYYLRVAALLHEVTYRVISLFKSVNSREVTLKIIEVLNKKALEQGTKFILAFVDIDAESRSVYHQRLKEHNIEHLDCLRDINSHSPQYRLPDGHPNAAMNLEIAKCIQHYLDPSNP